MQGATPTHSIFGSGVLQPYLIPILYVPVCSSAGAMCAYVQVWVHIYMQVQVHMYL